jgi:ISXO2-like transposase domain
VKTVQKAADIAVHAGSRLYTDSASSYRALKGYMHEFVNHTQKEYARGDVHENRAGYLFGSVANYRKQESLDSQVIDFPIYDFRVLPRKGNFATEPLRAHHERPIYAFRW